MSYGAGLVAAQRAGAVVVDPSPFAVGSIAETFARYPHARGILPAMGYSARQIAELEATIAATPCEAVVIGTPVDLARLCAIGPPCHRVIYDLTEIEPGALADLLGTVLPRVRAA
jgi:predicted GTPase